MYFNMKNTLKNNHNYTLKQALSIELIAYEHPKKGACQYWLAYMMPIAKQHFSLWAILSYKGKQ
jgi:hypothetical protein